MKFYSHKDKLIIEHLKEVRDLSKNNIPKDLENANNITSVCHDFGKYTTYFQEYLFSKDKNKSELSNHGFISAVFAAYAALCIYGKKTYMPYIIYNCVLHHHGSLENPSLDLPKDFSKIDENEDEVLLNKIDNCKKQLKDIKNNRKYIEKDYEELGFIDEFNSFLDKEPIEDTLLNIKKLDSIFDMKNKDEKFYFIHQLLYSALISADKISASNTYMPSIKYAEYEFLNKVKEDKFKNGELSKINKIRGEIFYNIQNELEKNYKDEKIFSITSPTGTGKTLSGFFAALKLKDLLKDNRKIIYSLPFTSIIDQNYESIYELLESIENFSKCENEYIIKHHNLSNVEYSSENENYDKNKAELLIENWTSGIVVTTFVQLLQTLIGNKNRMLKKFNSMRGAIILLDEIQAIDIKYLRLVDFILKGAVKYLDCRIIMMTATKPLILKESCELLYNNEEYFKMFNRTSIMPKINPITVEEFIEEFTNNIEEKSYLIICNTINQSLKIYDSLKNLDREVYYLSTNLLPFHRKNIINEVSYMLKKGENIILVSTQVVEAGVDFDFDVVIRDIGPMDSIIQAAGRCNRNGKKKNGQVYLYSMINDKEEYFGNIIYGKSIIAISKELLENKDLILEREYFYIIKEYFEKVNENINTEASDEFMESIKKLYFSYAPEEKYSINKFSLIKNNPDYIDVYFIINDEAEEVYKKFLNMLSEKDIIKRKYIYLQIKNKLKEYTLSLPSKYHGSFTKSVVPNLPFLVLPKEGCDDLYHPKTGFKREQEDFMVF